MRAASLECVGFMVDCGAQSGGTALERVQRAAVYKEGVYRIPRLQRMATSPARGDLDEASKRRIKGSELERMLFPARALNALRCAQAQSITFGVPPSCLPACLSACLPVCPPACLPARLSVCLSACLHAGWSPRRILSGRLHLTTGAISKPPGELMRVR